MPTLPRWLLPLALTLTGAVVAAFLYQNEKQAVIDHLSGFPDSHILSHSIRPAILAIICFLPALAALYYSISCTLDRYIIRQFLSIFAICLSALFLIWLLIDLNDNLSDFADSNNIFKTIAVFYFTRSPAILMLLLPYSLLLALIYGLGKFSKTNEIVSMIQSGRGVIRVTTPLLFGGIWCSLLLLGLNYQWAPTAEGQRREILAKARGIPIYEAKNVLYRDPESRRLWMVGAFPENYEKGEALINVEVTTTHNDLSLRTRLSASTASWNRNDRSWTFENATIARFSHGEAPIFEQPDEPIVRRTWQETPTQLIKPGLSVSYLGIPDLSTWLASPLADQPLANRPAYLTQWHYRWALPATCIVTVLLAAPLSIHFARRGAGSGIFLAIVLSLLMMFFSTIALALGEGAIIPPILSAWLPNITFTLIGLYLYHRRISGRPIYQSFRGLFPANS